MHVVRLISSRIWRRASEAVKLLRYCLGALASSRLIFSVANRPALVKRSIPLSPQAIGLTSSRIWRRASDAVLSYPAIAKG
jgi:hypothetical protein